MASAFVQTTKADSTASASSIAAAAFSSANTAGNLLVAWMTYAESGTNTPSVNVTDTAGNTWVEDTNGALWHTGTGTGYGSGFHVFYCQNCKAKSGNIVTANLGAGATFRSLVVSEYSGIATSGALIASAAQQMTGTTATDNFTSGSSGTLPSQPALVYGVMINVDAVTAGGPAGGTGYTQRGGHTAWGTGSNFGSSEDKRVTATTAVSATFTASAGRAFVYVGVFAEFQASGVLAKTLGSLTSSATGTLAIKGAEAKTLAALVLASAGTLAIKGALAKTLGAATTSSTGKLAINGLESGTLAPLTAAGTGKLAISAALARTLADDTVSSSGQLAIDGLQDGNLAPLTLAAEGFQTLPSGEGTLGATLHEMTLLSAAAGPIVETPIAELQGGGRPVKQFPIPYSVYSSEPQLAPRSGALAASLDDVGISATGRLPAKALRAQFSAQLSDLKAESAAVIDWSSADADDEDVLELAALTFLRAYDPPHHERVLQ